MTGWRGRRAAAVLVLGATMVAAGAGPVSAGPARPAGFVGVAGIGGTLGAPCFQLGTTPPGSAVLTQRRKGTPIAKVGFTGGPGANRCLKPLTPGDQLVLKVDGTTVRTITVPAITLTVDRPGNTISVVVPEGSTQLTILGIDRTAGYNAGVPWSAALTVGPDGSSGPVTPTWQLGLGDPIGVFWTPSNGLDQWQRFHQSSTLIAEVGQPAARGTARYRSTVTVTLRSGAGVVRGRLSTATDLDPEQPPGSWGGLLRKPGTRTKVRIRTGDRIGGSHILGSFRVPARTMQVTTTDDGGLTAACPPESDWVVVVNGVPIFADHTSTGAISVGSLVGSPPVPSGTQVALGCQLASGFGIRERFVVP